MNIPMDRRISVDVCTELVARAPRSREQLEQDAFRMLDAIESEVAEIAIGPVVACNFEKPSIDLMFCIEGSSTEDVHRRVGAVAEVIERVFSEGELRTSTAPTQDGEHASLCV
jgi:hypothetical protein